MWTVSLGLNLLCFSLMTLSILIVLLEKQHRIKRINKAGWHYYPFTADARISKASLGHPIRPLLRGVSTKDFAAHILSHKCFLTIKWWSLAFRLLRRVQNMSLILFIFIYFISTPLFSPTDLQCSPLLCFILVTTQTGKLDWACVTSPMSVFSREGIPTWLSQRLAWHSNHHTWFLSA